MREIRKLYYLRKYFWDYNIEKVREIKLAQRVVDFWSSIVEDFEENRLKKKDFFLILQLINNNFEKLDFKNSLKKNIIKGVIDKINLKGGSYGG